MSWYKQATIESIREISLAIPISPALDFIIKQVSIIGKKYDPNKQILSLIVGGSVRDAIMGIAPKDIDIECYNIVNLRETLERISSTLSSSFSNIKRAEVNLTGESFTVIKFYIEYDNKTKEDFDFSVPRKDSKRKGEEGHKAFDITADPSMGPQEACGRRDFTINSMCFNPFTNQLYDYYGGYNDIKNKTLRATSPAFKEDILRVFRGMQFLCRLFRKKCKKCGKEF